ncbi:hypothetical protein DIPPA_16001 [Diplonema papillatum]|nr:hypothetical protein DIPPA_16001 [Diplonema papillatum]
MAPMDASVADPFGVDKMADLDAFIASIMEKPPTGPFDEDAIGDLVKEVRKDKEMDIILKTSRDRGAAIVEEAEEAVKMQERLARASPRGDWAEGKVQVFVSMHGCMLLKTLSLPKNSTHDEFVAQIERKLGEAELTLYYEEDVSGKSEKVHIQDDDDVQLFLSKKDGKLKVTAIPAELMTTRMARTFGTYSPSSASGLGSARGSARGFFGPASARSSPGQWQSTMGSIEYNNTSVADATPRTAHGRRSSCGSSSPQSARRLSETGAGGS